MQVWNSNRPSDMFKLSMFIFILFKLKLARLEDTMYSSHARVRGGASANS